MVAWNGPSALSVEAPGDGGVSAILVAASLIMLMGMAAIVVDLGNAFGERRQAQSAVDFAALAALTSAVGPNPENAGAAEALDVVAANLPGRSLSWAACTDPARPPEYAVVSSTTDCVSFTENFDQSRVFLPNDDVATTFGRVIGFASVTVVADAEAEQRLQTTADIIPFTVAGDGCLFSNQAPQTVPPCDGPSDGNFGYLDIALHGNDEPGVGTPATCSQGSTNTRIAINLAKGSDHNMVEYDGGTPVNDHDTCPNRSENVDELEVRTGSATGGITDGLIDGVSGSINGQAFTASPGRFIPTPASVATASVRGDVLDDTPLWHFLNATGQGLCGTVTTLSEMKTCLGSWSPGDGDIFVRGLEDHKRFAAIPVFSIYPDDPTSGGSQPYTIDYFAPVYLETIYQGCNANRCTTVFSPGEMGGSAACPNPIAATTINCGHGSGGNNNVEGLTALVLQLGMLHPDTQEFFPGTLEGRELRLLR